MPKQSSEAARCKQYLINCFVHPLIAALFTTWEQVKRYNDGYSLEEALYLQTGESPPRTDLPGAHGHLCPIDHER